MRWVALLSSIVASLVACGGGAATPEPRPAGAASAGSSGAATSSAKAARVSRVVDGTGVCPYTSELDPAHGRAWPGCHVFAPMDFEFPLVACTEDAPCLQPCRRTDKVSGSVSYVHDFRYDAEGRLLEAVTRDENGGEVSTTRYTYESAKLWRILASGVFGNKESTMKLDDAGRLTERVSRFSSGTTLTFRFHYDASGRLVKEDRVEEKDGKTVEQPIPYEYDEKGRLLARERPHVGKPEFRYVYGADGKVETVEYHGIDWHVRRDAAGRAVELLDGKQPVEQLVYDARGRLVRVEDGARTREYTYDCGR